MKNVKKLLADLTQMLRSTAVGGFFLREVPPGKWIRRVILSTSVFLLVIAAAMTLFDPCFHYHSWKFIPRIYTRAYWQIPGILKTFDYDSVIVGSSTAQNFDLAVFRRELDVNPVKATASACSCRSGRVFAETAIRVNPKLRRVYYSLDLFVFFSPPDLDKTVLPDFLYAGTHCKDYCYWWNYDIMFIFLQDVQRNIESLIRRDGQYTDPDIMFAADYAGDLENHGRLAVVRSIRKKAFRQTTKLDEQGRRRALEHFVGNLDRNFVPLVREHPSTEFVFFLIPSSALNFADAEMHGTLEIFLRLRSMIAEKLLAFPNVRLYDFQIAPETLSVDNYKDLIHYVPGINDAMVGWMRQDRYRVRTTAEVAENNRILRQHADKLMPLWKKLLAEAEAVSGKR